MESHSFFEENESWIKAFIVLFLLVLILFLKSKEGNGEYYYSNELTKEHFEGKIVKKFIDKKNRSLATLILKNESLSVSLYPDFWEDLWDKCKTEDRLIKKSGDKIIYLIRHNEQDTLIIKYDRNSKIGIPTYDSTIYKSDY